MAEDGTQNTFGELRIENGVKMNIALKEADETAYWLELLKETDYISSKQFESIYNDSEELIKLLVSIIKTTKKNNS